MVVDGSRGRPASGVSQPKKVVLSQPPIPPPYGAHDAAPSSSSLTIFIYAAIAILAAIGVGTLLLYLNPHINPPLSTVHVTATALDTRHLAPAHDSLSCNGAFPNGTAKVLPVSGTSGHLLVDLGRSFLCSPLVLSTDPLHS